MELIISCPLKNAQCDCPFTELRKAAITDLIEITNRLSKEDIVAMTKEHKKCMRGRIKTLKAS